MISARVQRFAEFINRHGKEGLKSLTPREERVMTLLVEGKSYDEVGSCFALTASRIQSLARKADQKIKELEQRWEHQSRTALLTDPIKAFFFKAMQAGYAVEGIKKAKVVDMPGYKEIRYEDGEWLLVDRWCVNPDSEKSAGTTTIWHEGRPVWFMSYGGYYPEHLVPALKKALRLTYEKDTFNGGRGENVGDFEAGIFYVNTIERGDFSDFRGREEISTRSSESCVGETAGYHEYWGISLL